MAIDLVAASAKIQAVVETYGRGVRIIKQNRTPSDVNKPWRGSLDTPLEVPGVEVTGAFIPVSGSAAESVRAKTEQDGLVRRQVSQLFISSTDNETVDFENYDVVIDLGDNTVWRIEDVAEMKPGDISVYFEFTLSR